jgi:kynureninase
MHTAAECDAFDRADPLRALRHRFALPRDEHAPGRELVYLCGHSLGLMPHAARDDVTAVLDQWAAKGVEGHFEGDVPWYAYDDALVPAMAALVGADATEVSLMGTLTANLHHLFATFFRPHGSRTKILIESNAFPSDRYAVAAQLRWHGLDPREHLIEVVPDGSGRFGAERFVDVLASRGDEIALVWVGAVNYLTGEALDLRAITDAAHGAGCVAGFDLAHAAGNVQLRLHEWEVDFAAWCTYKYLNAGPGAVAAIFVHRRHGTDPGLVRLAGWWGNDPATRFDMPGEFVPVAGARGWRMSNPPILSLAPLRASLELFAQAGTDRLRTKSTALSGLSIDRLSGLRGIEVLTPRDERRRGNQVSIRIAGDARSLQRELRGRGVVVDVRPPDVVRIAAAPLYNRAIDVWSFTEAMRGLCA